MGGTGVVTAKPQQASLFNPALLLAPQLKKNQRAFAGGFIGARLLDRDGFLAAVDNYQDNKAEEVFDQRFKLAKANYQKGSLSSDEVRDVANAAEHWLEDINQLSDKPLRAALSYGFGGGKTQDTMAWGAHYRHYSVLGARIEVAAIDNLRVKQAIEILNIIADVADQSADIAELAEALDTQGLEQLIIEAINSGEVSDELAAFYDLPGVQELVAESIKAGELVTPLNEYFDFEGLAAALQNNADTEDKPELKRYLRYQIPEQFESTISVEGAEVDETSVSYATQLPADPALQVGVNLKHIKLTTIGLTERVEEFEYNDIKNSKYRKEYRSINADAGVFYKISPRYAVAAVVKNILPKNYHTANGHTIKYRPLLRIAGSYKQKKLQLVADLDITRNDPLGYDPDKQYLGLGAEWMIVPRAAIRAGLRNNLHNDERLYSLGFGVGSKNASVDFAIAKSNKNEELGAALQIAIKF
ncbi:conjugal transfer protein TraF [Dasania sp. GY-MA-18]|nr:MULTISPECIES: conjugal transfer protein TraF [Dasania]MCR8921988.1 conjugal transfer protein TraF [Dasania sp. GY-MA-18]MCZ0868144.1 conjugal transfer protein TraF [Dasania phycosphaerae]